jgi:putative CocE/NonD family hydrolase
LSNVNGSYLHGTIPTWNDFTAHPNFDAFWKAQAVATYVKAVTVPTLNVAGWWDQEDFYGPLKIYEELEKRDTQGRNFFVAGPWNHGGWSRDGSKLGKIAFGDDTGLYFREKIQAPFFAWFLKDKGPFVPAEAWTFQTGSNVWTTHDQWPPRQKAADRSLYFRENGKLSFDPPAGDEEAACDVYVSDPAHPVPYRPRPIEPTYYPRGSGWPTWQVEDQRFVHQRPDVLSWVTDPLAEDVVLTGNIAAHLFASTTGTDADWVVKLIDVYPEDYKPEPKMGGYQLMIVGDVLRGRFRRSFEKPEPIPANRVQEYGIDLHQTDHRFLKGHRIMVQVQSSWFPLIDRNPQTYVDNIFQAKESDYRPATQKIFRSAKYPSRLTLMVLPN